MCVYVSVRLHVKELKVGPSDCREWFWKNKQVVNEEHHSEKEVEKKRHQKDKGECTERGIENKKQGTEELRMEKNADAHLAVQSIEKNVR